MNIAVIYAVNNDENYYPSLIVLEIKKMYPELPYFDESYQGDYSEKGTHLAWKTLRSRQEMKRAKYFVIYRFPLGEAENLQDPRAIVGIVRQPYFSLPSHPHAGEWVYHVSAFNRLHQESASERMVIRVK